MAMETPTFLRPKQVAPSPRASGWSRPARREFQGIWLGHGLWIPRSYYGGFLKWGTTKKKKNKGVSTLKCCWIAVDSVYSPTHSAISEVSILRHGLTWFGVSLLSESPTSMNGGWPLCQKSLRMQASMVLYRLMFEVYFIFLLTLYFVRKIMELSWYSGTHHKLPYLVAECSLLVRLHGGW